MTNMETTMTTTPLWSPHREVRLTIGELLPKYITMSVFENLPGRDPRSIGSGFIMTGDDARKLAGMLLQAADEVEF